MAFVTDITERKKLDQAIRQRESELGALFDSSPDTHARFDSNTARHSRQRCVWEDVGNRCAHCSR